MGRYCMGWLLVALLSRSWGGSRFPRGACPAWCAGSLPPPEPTLASAESEKEIEIKAPEEDHEGGTLSKKHKIRVVIFKSFGCPEVRTEVYGSQVQPYTDCHGEEHLASFYPLSPTSLLSSSKVKPCSIPAGQRSFSILWHEENHGWVTRHARVCVGGGGDAGCPWTCAAARVCCVKPCKLVLCWSYLSHTVRYMRARMDGHLWGKTLLSHWFGGSAREPC